MTPPKKIAQHSLPRAEREALCRALLAEFGVTRIRHDSDRYELIHSCPLPGGAHKNGDRNPSASINYDTLTFRCLGCDTKGGVYWFIGMCRGTSGTLARHWLDGQTEGPPDGRPLHELLALLDEIYNAPDGRPPPMPKMSPRMLDGWRFIHPYLTDSAPPCRGIPESNVVTLQWGWDPEADRIVIPHFWKGDLVGWQTRRISKRDPNRWLSSPDFPRDRTIYNFDGSRRIAVMVESPMSVGRHVHHQPLEGFFGASVTEQQVRQAVAHDKIILWGDNDEAGWKWTITRHDGYGRSRRRIPCLAEQLSDYSDVWAVQSPWAADPADMSDDLVDELVASAVPWTSWKRPEVLYCIKCKNAHEGLCEGVAA